MLLREAVEPYLPQDSPAFLEEEAAATLIPASLTAMTKRSASGVGGEVAGLDQPDHHCLLPVGVKGETPAVVIGDVEVRQRRARRSCEACRTSAPRRRGT